MDSSQIIQQIKESIGTTAPDATAILYGSFASGRQRANSDIDILILVNSASPSTSEIRRIKDPLYDIEFETGQIISPLVLSRTDWRGKHSITPFYENVNSEGVRL